MDNVFRRQRKGGVSQRWHRYDALCVCADRSAMVLLHAYVVFVCLAAIIRFPLSLSLFQGSRAFSQVAFSTGPAMEDTRTAKRVAQVLYIRSKSYYKPWIEEPNPFAENCSTRKWRWVVKEWIQTVKDLDDEGGQRDVAPRRDGRVC